MKNNLFHVVLACCLVGGTWLASHPLPDLQEPVVVASPLVASAESDVMEPRTGDRFWGLHLCGVVPCSTLTIKGGGHIVTLSPQSDANERCFFQVVGDKRIELLGKKFQIRVIAPDQIRVERAPAESTVATR